MVKYAQLHFSSPRLPGQFISMDLMYPFDPSSNEHHYALTMICMLTEYMFCMPLKIKTASKVVQVYINEIYAKFRESIKILSENGTEFKNQSFTGVATYLGVE